MQDETTKRLNLTQVAGAYIPASRPTGGHANQVAATRFDSPIAVLAGEGVGLAIGGGSGDVTDNGGGTRCADPNWGTVSRLMHMDGSVNTPEFTDDFPLGPACDLSGDGTCESCQ